MKIHNDSLLVKEGIFVDYREWTAYISELNLARATHDPLACGGSEERGLG